MAKQPKILLLDDDQEFLELYQEMLSRHLPSMPEVRVVNSSTKALAMLEAEPFTLFSVDLNLPKIDGLQVITIARRKFPKLRMLVLTGIRDEQFRNRAYAMGVDQYWIKPETDEEIALLMEAFESLLSKEAEGGFRGIQSKSLMDIVQLECLSQSSSVLRITNGRHDAKIWLVKGEVIDAELEDLTAEAAFQKILNWKTGCFEILPPDLERPRTIFTSYQGLLLNTVQALDEAASLLQPHPNLDGSPSAPETISRFGTVLAELAQIPGIEFIVTQEKGQKKSQDYFGLDSPDAIDQWARDTWSSIRSLADVLHVGETKEILGIGSRRKMVLVNSGSTDLCLGMTSTLPEDTTRDIVKSILAKWAS